MKLSYSDFSPFVLKCKLIKYNKVVRIDELMKKKKVLQVYGSNFMGKVQFAFGFCFHCELTNFA